MIFMLLSLVWPYPGNEKKFQISYLGKHEHERMAEWFLNSEKSKQSLKIMRFVKI